MLCLGSSLVHTSPKYAQQVPDPSQRSQQWGRCHTCGVGNCPPSFSCWLCKTHWCAMIQNCFMFPLVFDPSPEGLFLLCLVNAYSFQVSSHLKEVLSSCDCLSAVAGALFSLPDYELWQERICVSALLKLKFNLYQSHIYDFKSQVTLQGLGRRLWIILMIHILMIHYPGL